MKHIFFFLMIKIHPKIPIEIEVSHEKIKCKKNDNGYICIFI